VSGLRVRDLMTPGVLDVAAAVVLEDKYGCLPVLEQGLLAGILTEANFVRYVAETASETESTRDLARSRG